MGGDVITDKTTPFSVKKRIISQLIKEIKQNYQIQKNKLILVHGGGSFGHPIATKYHVQEGLGDLPSQNQKAIIETHNAVLRLNSIIIEEFALNNLPIFSLAPVSQFFMKDQELIFTGLSQIESLLELNIIPILYGDILLHSPLNCSILSGDRIISKICESSLQNKIKKVIFLINEDGLLKNYNHPSMMPEIIEKIAFNEKIDPILSTNENKMDVTGGMQGKIAEIRKICSQGIPVVLINGTKKNRLKKELNNENKIKTLFLPKKTD